MYVNLRFIFLLLLLISSGLANVTPVQAMSAMNLRCEYLKGPLGIDVTAPRLSWVLDSDQRGDCQTAYQVLVASSTNLLNEAQADLWNSGKVVSDQSVLVSYAGKALTSGEMCFWSVRVWDRNGTASAWSSSAQWSMGLLNATDWVARWIGMNENTNTVPAPSSPMLRKTFSSTKSVSRATAYVCGLGYHELYLNGSKVGDSVLEPVWTRYDAHACYTTYDVTTNLISGLNGIGVQLANGFYNQWATDSWNTCSAPWRALPQLLFQMVIKYSDGTQATVVSDESWKVASGPLVLDTTRLGEVYDARLEKPGWATAGYDDTGWSNAILREGITGNLLAPNAEPIKVLQSICAVQIIPVTGKPGVYTFDFGQNLAGWGLLNVTGAAGTTITMVYGEKLNGDGSVNQANINNYVKLTNYFQKDIYILKGSGNESYAPRFTYHGFRYAQVSGLPTTPTTNTLVAQVVRTAFETAGSFVCSSDLLNRIETNTIWSYVGNFVGIPTDCPHREKNGWTGDAQLACEMGLTHFHSEAAYTRWLRDIPPEQLSNGKLSGVIPNAVWGYNMDDGPSWESAILLIPWFMYQHCGDVRILTNNYSTMKAYVDYETSVASGNIVSYGLADWEPANTKTPAAVTDTAYYYQDACILAQTAAMMGNTAGSVQYSNLAAQIRTSFNNSFYNSANNTYSVGSQTAQSCALYQGLANSNQSFAVSSQLASSVQQNGNKIDTGNLGSKYLLRALCDYGQANTAMALALQTNYPSWGNFTQNGSTTLWETWNGTGSHDSLNHIMFGDISGWFIEYLAGIRPGAPGYKVAVIKPEITGAIKWAKGSHDSPYGNISSSWQLNGSAITLDITVPFGSTGLVYLPTLGTAPANLRICENGVNIWTNGSATGNLPEVAFNRFEGSNVQTYAVWNVPSGSYKLSWNIFSAPDGLSAQAGSGWVNLNWSPVIGATGYAVKRSEVSGGPYDTVTNLYPVTNYGDMSVINDKTYYYVVSALGINGESLNSSEVAAAPSSVPNSGFETPRVSTYSYNPSGGFWNFTGASPSGSGIAANNSGFTSKNPDALEGTQVAFIQSCGSIAQTLVGFVPGTDYTVRFLAAERNGPSQHGGQSWNLSIDNSIIGSFNPSSKATNYAWYAAGFTANSTVHHLQFTGTDLATGDNTVFIDSVLIDPPLQPALCSVALESPGNNAVFASSSVISLSASVAANGNVVNGVNFYVNQTNLIGAAVSAPYAYQWTNVPAGDYNITARVIFNGGGIADSASKHIRVTNLTPVIRGAGLTNGALKISGSGQVARDYILETTTNLAPVGLWRPIVTNSSDSSGSVEFTNLPLDKKIQFYRIFSP